MLFAELAETSRQIAETSARLKKIDLLAGLLRRLRPDEAEIAVPYLTGETRQGKTGVGYSLLREAKAPPADSATLQIVDVDSTLEAISTVKGSGSTSRRKEALYSLFARATELEQQFLLGVLTGELRQGAMAGIAVDALARAVALPLDRVRRAVMMAGNLANVATSVLQHGESALADYDVRLFRPVHPMLAQTAEDIDSALEELGEASLEYKMDGARVQVHKSGDEVVVYSRRLNEVTSAVPEIVEAVRRLPERDLILDGEVIGLDEVDRPRPFQVTMRRFGRKLDVERLRQELPLQPFWFDLLYANGSLIDEPQHKRFETLSKLAPSPEVIPHLRTSDPKAAAEFVDRSHERGHEGVMAKAPDAHYIAGARGQSWLKVKQAKTLDLVVLAAEWGNGRRQGWLSNLHLGARDTVKGGFAMLGKTFKGLTDEVLEWQTREFLKIEIARDQYTVYLEPKIVVEIAFNDVQISPRYVSGLALRFARVKRYRPDKSADQADTYETVQKFAVPV